VLKLITIRNDTKQPVIRANLLFPGGGVVRFVMDNTISKFKEIKACSSLKVVSIEDVPTESYEQPPVLKVDVAKSVVVDPEPAVKEEESFVYDDSAPTTEPVKAPPVAAAPPEPEVDVIPVVVSPEVPLPDVTELEVVEVADEESEVTISYSCPYCDFSSAAKTGTFHHVRFKHPDHYEEYKERLTKL